MVLLSFTTSESSSSTRTLTYTLPNLNELTKISVNTGTVLVQSISGDSVTVRVSGGSWSSRSVSGWNSNPDLTKTVTEQTSSNYSDSDGYSGTLTRYLYDTIVVEDQSRSEATYRTSSNPANYPDLIEYDSGGFKGILRKVGSPVVISGSPQETDSKYVDKNYSSTVNVTYIAEENERGQRYWTEISRTYSPDKAYYSEGGYSGYLFPYHWIILDPSSSSGYPKYKGEIGYASDRDTGWRYGGTVTKVIKEDSRVWEQKYSGTVIKKGSKQEIYKYKGTVRKSVPDSPIYTYYYAYTITFDYIDFVAPPVNVNGQWREVKEVFTKVDGTWRKVTNIYGNVNGVWKHHVK